MSNKSRSYLKGKWVQGFKPAQLDYVDFFDSFYNIQDDILPSGTVNSIYITSSNGIISSVQNYTTSPFISLSLGNITPNSINGVILSGNYSPMLSVSGTSFVSNINTGDQTITLTGDVSGTGTGTFSTTISSSVITGKILTGYISGSGIINSSDSILSAIQKLNGNISAITSGVNGVSSVNGLTGSVSLFGVPNRITISGTNSFDISSNYVGQSSITTVGTITSGTWSGSAIGINNGGTGATTSNNALNNFLPVQIGNNSLFLQTNGTNSSWVNPSSSILTGYVSSNGIISSSDSILSAIQKLNGNLSSIITGVSNVNGVTGSVILSGTTNRITISGTNSFDISSNYIGQSSINTVGTIISGTWSGSAIGISSGGTGATTSNIALNNLLPIQIGNSNLFLQTNGTSSSWVNPSLSILTGLTVTGLTVSSTDSILSAFGKIQNQLNSSVSGTGTTNYIPKWSSLNTLSLSSIYDNGVSVGIGVTSSLARVHIFGTSSNNINQRLEPSIGVTEDTTGSSVNTIDGTVNVIAQIISVGINNIISLETTIVYRKTAGTGTGLIGDGTALKFNTSVKNINGVLKLDTIQNTYTGTVNAISGVSATFLISGTNIQVCVTGVVNNNISWNIISKINTIG